jgi:hypothetical protein
VTGNFFKRPWPKEVAGLAQEEHERTLRRGKRRVDASLKE